MKGEEATATVVGVLDELDIPYMLVGSFSSNFYGVPRGTQDADLVVQLQDTSVQTIAERLGPMFRLESQVSFETVTGTTRHVLQVADSAFTIELFLLSGDPHDQERFRRRRQVLTLSQATFVPTPEDVIITKLRWSERGARTKDVDDVRNVIAVQADGVDWDYVNAWCDRHGTRDLLDEIRRSIPAV